MKSIYHKIKEHLDDLKERLDCLVLSLEHPDDLDAIQVIMKDLQNLTKFPY